MDKTVQQHRVILFTDVNAFEFQVWAWKKRPDLLFKKVPAIVINKFNLILSVNSAGKKAGIKRKNATGDGLHNLQHAQEICSQANLPLEIIRTDIRYGRTDSFTPWKKSHDLTAEFLQFFQENYPTAVLERSASDEHFVDVTLEVNRLQNRPHRGLKTLSTPGWLPPLETTHLLSFKTKENTDEIHSNDYMAVLATEDKEYRGDKLFTRIRSTPRGPTSSSDDRELYFKESRLFFGAIIAQEIKNFMWEKTGFVVSVGVGENKLQAKMGCSQNQPDGITIITEQGFRRLAKSTFLLKDIPGFGGVQGITLQSHLDDLFVQDDVCIGKIQKIPRETLARFCKGLADSLHKDVEEVVTELLSKCRGMDDSPVVQKTKNDSLSITASFTGARVWDTFETFARAMTFDLKERMDYLQIQNTVMSLKVIPSYRRPYRFLNLDTRIRIEKRTFSPAEIVKFIINYVKSNLLPVNEIHKVKLSVKTNSNPLLDTISNLTPIINTVSKIIE